MEDIKKELSQKLGDLEYFVNSLNSHSQSVEEFTKEMKISAEHVGIASNLIQGLTEEVINKFNEFDFEKKEYEEKYNQAIQILEEQKYLSERVLYCEDMIKFFLQFFEDKGMLPGQANENKTIILDKNLPTGKYTLKYENEDGTETIIDTVTM